MWVFRFTLWHLNFFPGNNISHVFNQTLLDEKYETLLYINVRTSVIRQVSSQVVDIFKFHLDKIIQYIMFWFIKCYIQLLIQLFAKF